MQHVVVIVKPHAVQHRLALLQRFKNAGFRLIGERVVDVNVDEAWFICKDQSGLTNIANAQTEAAVHSLLGTAIVFLLNHNDAFQVLRDMAGPEDPVQARTAQPRSLRALYGEQGSFNAISLADTPEKATKFIQHFFPRYSDLLHGPTGNIAEEGILIDEYFRTRMLPTLLDAFYDMCVVKPAEPVTYLSNFLLKNNPNRPKVLGPSDIRTQRGQSGFTSTSDYREQTKQSANTSIGGLMRPTQSKEISTADFEQEMQRSGYTNTSVFEAPVRSVYASTGDFYRESQRVGKTSMGGKEETERTHHQTSMGGQEELQWNHQQTSTRGPSHEANMRYEKQTSMGGREHTRRSNQTSMGGREEIQRTQQTSMGGREAGPGAFTMTENRTT
ncbi:hypothetical protein RvY_15650 [Ramazzottius varieornatus]|uniref:Nucleoside diphosphate kinase-like domain-containing protein n=1 Tax=Ramazzottius varieornatus TaxID=947166 RepID=A0A1D1VVM8_RAMVA|nr:hypothetical protein RvY_15650 [Ramazzottius varieornatus]